MIDLSWPDRSRASPPTTQIRPTSKCFVEGSGQRRTAIGSATMSWRSVSTTVPPIAGAGDRARRNLLAISRRGARTWRCPWQALWEVDPVASPLAWKLGCAREGRSSVKRSITRSARSAHRLPEPYANATASATHRIGSSRRSASALFRWSIFGRQGLISRVASRPDSHRRSQAQTSGIISCHAWASRCSASTSATVG